MEDKIASMGQGSTVLSINKDNLHGLLMPNADKHQQEQFIAFAQQSDKSKFASDTEARDFRLLSNLIRNYDNMIVTDGN